MVDVGGAIELPASRFSRNLEKEDPDVHDPNYIPLLNREISLKVDFSRPSFYGLPSVPTPRKDDVQTSLQRSNSSSAPEPIIQFRPTHNLPSRRPTGSKQNAPLEIGSSQTELKKEEIYPGSPSLSVSEPSVIWTTNSLEEHVYTVPSNFKAKADELQYPAVPHSSRSSLSSSKRSVPTSRYNKYSLASIPSQAVGTMSFRSSIPLLLPDEGLEVVQPQPQLHETVATPPLPPIPDFSPEEPVMRLLPMKSTASERRGRALNSHPSNMPLKPKSSPRVGDGYDSESLRLISRPKSIVNSSQPSPAPDTPLPDLPPQARVQREIERSTERRQERAVTPSTISSIKAPTIRNHHADPSESMTSKKSTLFRRFDDVHVRLLLHLQEEIAALEKQLLTLENENSGSHDNNIAKAKVLQELRKAVAEYDNLFATWNAMQANKADDATKEQLNEWLQHSASSGSISQNAKDDLSWLQPSKNRSSLSIDPEKNTSETGLANTNRRTESSPTFASSLLAWFGCASKRR